LTKGRHLHTQASLDKAKSWIKELQRQADPSIIVALVGNKCDLAPERRSVEKEDAERYAEEENLLFFETSAKTAEGVKGVFESIGELRHIYRVVGGVFV